jgi:hypothetical protein
LEAARTLGLSFQGISRLLHNFPPAMPRKRTRDEMEAAGPEEKKAEPSLLQKIRNMWEFASVMQFIFMFGKAVKIDEDFDIEVLFPFPILPFFGRCTGRDVMTAEWFQGAEWLTFTF